MNRRKFIEAGIAAAPIAIFSKVSDDKMSDNEERVNNNDPQTIRLWRLGRLAKDMEHGLYPTPQAIEKLAKIIRAWDKKAPLDLIWGPDLEMIQYSASDDVVDLVTINGPTATDILDSMFEKIKSLPGNAFCVKFLTDNREAILESIIDTQGTTK